MPNLTKITLTVNGNAEEYNPASSTGNTAEFLDSSPSFVYDARFLRMKIRPSAAGNTGRTTETLGVRPIPISESGGCCVDVTTPEGNTFNVATMVRKTSTKQQANDLVDMIKSYVATDAFRQMVTESSFF